MSDKAPKRGTAPAPENDLLDGAVALLFGFRGEGLHRATASALSSKGLPNSVRIVESLDELDRWMANRTVCLLAVGPEASAHETLQFLGELPERHSFQRPTFVLISDIELHEQVTEPTPEAVALFDLIQEDRVFFWSRFAPPEHELVGLLVAGVDHFRRQMLLDFAAAPRVKDPRAIALRKLLTIAEASGRAGDLASLQEPVLEAADELVGIESGRLWLYDSVLHSLTPLDNPDEESSAVAGLTSFVVRSGTPARCPDSAEDPRYDADVDGPSGRFLAVPIGGPEGRITGALTARRGAGEAAFDEAEQGLLERLALHLMPVFSVRAPQPLETVIALRKDGIGYRLFREEAVEAHARGFAEKGKLLQTEPGWSKWTWRTLVSGFLAAVLFSIFFRMHDYASGSAVVQVGRKVDVTSPLSAPVISVQVEPGQEVAAGEPLVLLYGAPEASEMETLEREFEQRMRQRLADPGDPAVEASLVAARTSLERARDRLAERMVRAPVDGWVGDVRIRPGRHLVTGELVMSIIADTDQRTVVGLIPGRFGPQLAAGQPIRLTLDGYSDLSFELEARAVGEELIGPEQVDRSLRGAIAGTVLTSGPVVLVEASLPSESFSDGRRNWVFRDGMLGRMEIRVRSQPIIFHLMPGLDRAFGKTLGKTESKTEGKAEGKTEAETAGRAADRAMEPSEHQEATP